MTEPKDEDVGGSGRGGGGRSKGGGRAADPSPPSEGPMEGSIRCHASAIRVPGVLGWGAAVVVVAWGGVDNGLFHGSRRGGAHRSFECTGRGFCGALVPSTSDRRARVLPLKRIHNTNMLILMWGRPDAECQVDPCPRKSHHHHTDQPVSQG